MFRDVLSMTQTGTLRFCLPAFSRRIFFAAGLLRDIFSPQILLMLVSLRPSERPLRIRLSCWSLTGVAIFFSLDKVARCVLTRVVNSGLTRFKLANLDLASGVRIVFIAASNCAIAACCDSF